MSLFITTTDHNYSRQKTFLFQAPSESGSFSFKFLRTKPVLSFWTRAIPLRFKTVTIFIFLLFLVRHVHIPIYGQDHIYYVSIVKTCSFDCREALKCQLSPFAILNLQSNFHSNLFPEHRSAMTFLDESLNEVNNNNYNDTFI